MVGFIHTFQMKNKYMGFDPLSKTLLILDSKEVEVINKIKRNAPLTLSERQMLSEIQKTLDSKRENVNPIIVPAEINPNMMVLMVSQTCNMKCAYCYACEGTYTKPGILRIELGKRALDIANELGVDTVQFYGGEPLLNFDSIEKLVEYADINGYKFRYGIVTNGTLINRRIADFFTQYDFEVTVSVDGPQVVNDLNRKYKNGKGTYTDIIKGLELLNERSIKLALEVTYARNYIQKYSIRDILSHLSKYSKTFVVGYVLPSVQFQNNIIRDKYALKEAEIEEFLKELVDYLFDKWEEGIPIKEMGICRILREILDPEYHVKTYICSEMPLRITVFHDGDVYPCHQTYLDRRFYLGNIKDKDFTKLLTEKMSRAAEHFTMSKLKLHDAWFSNLGDFCRIHLKEKVKGTYVPKYPRAYERTFEHILYNVATRDMKKVIETLGGNIVG